MTFDNWFLLQFKPNSHRLAERNLVRQGFDTFLPMQQITQRRATQFVTENRPLFPGYMFVGFDAATAPWRKINATYGVSRLVSFTSIPKSMPAQFMQALMSRCDDAGVLLPPKALEAGDKVTVINGPFANFIATVEKIDAQKRVWILLDFMGQVSKIRVAPELVQLSA